MDFNDYEDEAEKIIDGHWDSLEDLKNDHPDNWKQVVLEVKFRNLAHMEEI